MRREALRPQAGRAPAAPTAAGERVLAYALALAQGEWRERFVAAYALGSLAHGGFSPAVSDVDVAFVLADPLDDDDAEAVARISRRTRESGLALAERLSVFWGSSATLSGAARGGRFPPHDMLDLRQFGRLLAGRDVRARVQAPTLRELIVATAGFALRMLATGEVTGLLRDPSRLAAAGPKQLSKVVLYPVRFLFTARTGEVGRNDEAVGHFLAAETGPAAALAREALAWRRTPPAGGDAAVAARLLEGALPLYQIFLDDYAQRLRDFGEHELTQAYGEWRQRLE